MWWVFALVGLLLVVVIALFAVQRVVNRLAREPERNVFDSGEAVEFVAQALPASLTAQLTYEDVQRILRLHLDFLHREGVARSGGDLGVTEGASVLRAEDGVAYVLERAALVDFRPDRDVVHQVIEAQVAYFEAIGVVEPVLDPAGELAGEGVSPPA